jgi:hypothetical protein
MYIESKPGDLGFAERQMGLSQSSDVQIMGPPPAAAPAPAAPMVMSPAAMSTEEGGHARLAAGMAIAMTLGLGFVIWKATR